MSGVSEEGSEGRGFRQLSGTFRWVERVLLSSLPLLGTLYVLDLHSYLRVVIYKEQYLGLFLAFSLASVFLTLPATKGGGKKSVPWYDAVSAVLSLSVGLYIAVLYPTLVFEVGYATPDKVVLGTLAIVLVLEATRRVTGWPLVIISVSFILYAQFAGIFPGFLQAKPTPWPKLATYLYLDTNALLGLPFAIAGTVALAFILFGQILFATGGGRFLTDFSMAIFGKFRGGPAKMAVVASSLFGTISGSPVANVFTTGTVTIPLMKRTGYSAELAGAIEAVSSTGGQIMPPVMGIVAFMIADFLSIPYWEVATGAFLPAVLFYATLFIQVDLEAAKAGMKGLRSADLPSLAPVLRRGWGFIVPLLVLIYTLFFLHFDAAKSAMVATAAVLVISLVQTETRMGIKGLLRMLESTGKTLLDIAMITAAVGFVIGVFSISGLGPIFSLLLIELGGGHSLLLLGWTALACMILGLGMPVGPVYLLLAVLVAPALTQLGMDPLAVHLFIFYYGVLSFITPPVAIAAFAAANLAGAAPMRTGLLAMRLGVVGYVIPFIFIFSPSLMMKAHWASVILAAGTALLGTGFLAVAFAGYLFRCLRWFTRVSLAAAGISLLIPPTSGISFSWSLNLVGFGVGGLLIVLEWRHHQRAVARHHTAAPDFS